MPYASTAEPLIMNALEYVVFTAIASFMVNSKHFFLQSMVLIAVINNFKHEG